MAAWTETTLAATLTPRQGIPQLASPSAAAVGGVLVIDREAMDILALTGSGQPRVMRGASVTAAVEHAIGTAVYIGSRTDLHHTDPVGLPQAGVQAHWFNLATGVLWVATGDEVGPGTAARVWVPQVITRTIGALGVRQKTVTP